MASKINDVDAPYPRRLRKTLPEAIDIAVKILRLKNAKESAWTLQDAFKRSLKKKKARRRLTERCSFCPKAAKVRKIIQGSIGTKVPLCISCWRKS